MNTEGQESTHVLDAAKLTCPYCGGPEVMLSSLMADPNHIADTVYEAHYITYTGNTCQGLVGLCAQCGHEWVPFWYILDAVTNATAAAITMTHLDASILNGLTGCYAIYLDAAGTDTGLYYTISTNTAAPPTVITLSIATNNNETGMWMITNILPYGRTAAS